MSARTDATAFERATAVRPAGEGRFRAGCDGGWFAPRGPNGGYLAAIALRAMAVALDSPERHPRSLTLHYLRPPAEGELDIAVAIARAGRRLSTLTARIEQSGRLCTMAIGAFAVDFPGSLDYAQPMPVVRPVAELEPAPRSELMPAVAHRFELRPALGPEPFSGADTALTGGWLRFADGPQRIDPVALAMLADAWLPAPFTRLRGPVPAPTVDLTIHFRAPELDVAEPVLGVFPSRFSHAGLFEEDAELWSERRPPAGPQPPARAADRMTGHLGLGSNVGDRRANLQAAVDALGAHGVAVLASSSTYDTDPVGEVLDQPAFLNACVRVETALGPEELLDACKAVERDLGRAPRRRPRGTARGRSTSTCCCSAASSTRSERPRGAPRAGRRAPLRPGAAARARPRAGAPRTATALADGSPSCRSTRASAGRAPRSTCRRRPLRRRPGSHAGRVGAGRHRARVRGEQAQRKRAGRPDSISGRTSPIVISSRSVARDLQVGRVGAPCAPARRVGAEHALGDPGVDAVEVPGQRSQVGLHAGVVGVVHAALDAGDHRGEREHGRTRQRRQLGALLVADHRPRVARERGPQQRAPERLKHALAPALGLLDALGRGTGGARPRSRPGGA